MASIIDLNGKWQIEGQEGDSVYPRMQGDVPGSVYTAALQAHIIESSQKGKNILHNAWLAQRSWRYSRQFSVADDITENRYILYIGKTNPGAQLRVNSHDFGEIPHLCAEIDISAAIKSGENTIVFSMDGMAQLQDISIDCFARARISGADLHWTQDGALHCDLCIEAFESGKYDLQLRLMQGANAVQALDLPLTLRTGENTFSQTLTPPNPAPWDSAQEQYTCLLSLDKLSVRMHRRIVKTGFAVWRRENGSLLSLGKKRFLRGAVWQANYREDKRDLLLQLRDAHINALRVTDVETDAFYALCDTLGIAIWQEAENASPEDWQRIIAHLGAHPCLMLADPGALRFADGSPADNRHPKAHAFLSALENIAHIPLLPASPSDDGDLRGPYQFTSAGELAAHLQKDESLLRSDVAFPAFARNTAAFEADAAIFPLEQTNAFWALRQAWRANYPEDLVGPPGSAAELPAFVRFSRFLQAQILRMECEAMIRRQGETSGVFAGYIPAENALLDASLFDGPLPRPALSALRGAFAENSLQARLNHIVFAPGETLDADIVLCCADETICTVESSLFDMQGKPCGQESYTMHATAPLCRIGRFSHTFAKDARGIYLLRLEATLQDKKLRGEYALAINSEKNLLPLRHAPIIHAKLQRSADASYIANDSDAIAFGLHMPDAHCRLPDGYSALLPQEQIALLQSGDAEIPKPEMLGQSL